MDRKQLTWLHPAAEHLGLAYAFWSKVWNANLLQSAVAIPQPVLLRGPLLGEHLLTMMLSNQANRQSNAAPLIVANYQLGEVMLTAWTGADPSGHPLYSKFLRVSPATDSLHREIVQFYEYMMPTKCERYIRKQAIDRISRIIETSLPGVQKVSVFGSYRTGLCLPTSDIDLVVFGEWQSPPLSELRDILIEKSVASEENMKALDRASVPIIKLTDSLTGIRFDISFNMMNGTRSIEVIKDFLTEFPPLRYLVIVLKYFLLQRDLNEVFSGGIGSYALIMMTVSFLQHHPCTDSRVLGNCNLGQLLIDFFELYGRTFNYSRVGIRIRDGGSYFPRDDSTNSPFGAVYRGTMLCIEDPLDQTNDIGKGSYAAHIVREQFDNAFVLLSKAVDLIDFSTKVTGMSRMSLLGRIIGVNSKVIQYRNWIRTVYENIMHHESSKENQETAAETPPSLKRDDDDGGEESASSPTPSSCSDASSSQRPSPKREPSIYVRHPARHSRCFNEDRHFRPLPTRQWRGRRFVNRQVPSLSYANGVAYNEQSGK